MSKIPCTVEILTLNSGKTLEKCLESVKDFDDIIVLDGNSTDETVEIAKKYGARIFPQKETSEKNVRIEDFAEIRNKGLALAKNRWFLFIDSDEYLSKEAALEIGAIAVTGSEYGVFRLPRRFILNGQAIERSASYPNYQLRFFNRDSVMPFTKKVHESIKIKPGTKIGTLNNPEYVPLDSIEVAREKMFHYLDIQAEALENLSFKRLWRGLCGNAQKALALGIKYLLTFAQGKGKKMPFAYEYYTIIYHVKLFGRLIGNYWRKYWRKN